jgi:hypothetical protein
MENNRNRTGHFSAGSTSHLGGIAGPSEADLKAIEGGSETAGVFSDADIAAYRSDERRMNPQAAAIHNARTIGHGLDTHIPISEGLDTSIDAPTRNFGDVEAQGDLMGNIAEASKTGEVAAGEGAADFAYDEESTGRGRRFGAVGLGAVEEAPGPRVSPFTKIAESGDEGRRSLTGAGLLMMREAGRCDSPGCQLLRATGMTLTGQTRQAKSGISSNLSAIPSVSTAKSEYPIDPKTGKQDRKNPRTVLEFKPEDPNNPEYRALTDEVKGNSRALFFPEDALAHQHDDEEAHLAYVQERIRGLTGHLGDYS